MPDRIKTELEVHDERFRPVGGDAWTERLFTGGRWTEGPAYFPAGRYLVFSDIRPVHHRHQLAVLRAPQHHRRPLSLAAVLAEPAG